MYSWNICILKARAAYIGCDKEFIFEGNKIWSGDLRQNPVALPNKNVSLSCLLINVVVAFLFIRSMYRLFVCFPFWLNRTQSIIDTNVSTRLFLGMSHLRYILTSTSFITRLLDACSANKALLSGLPHGSFFWKIQLLSLNPFAFNPQSISQAWVRPAESSSKAIDVPLKAQLIYQVTM